MEQNDTLIVRERKLKIAGGNWQVNHRDNAHNNSLQLMALKSSLRSRRISENILQVFLTSQSSDKRVSVFVIYFITKLENIQSVVRLRQKLQSRQTAQFHLQCYLSFYFNKKKCQFSSFSSST